MKRRSFLGLSGGLLLHACAGRAGPQPPTDVCATSPGAETGPAWRSRDGVEYLSQVMDQFHDRFPVYDDVSSAGNHFHAWAKLPDENASVSMNGSCAADPRRGATCIRCEFTRRGKNAGGFYMMNGILPPGERRPLPNFGVEPHAGIDLTGATRLTFWVRGQGRVEFFMGGVGWEPFTRVRIARYPDSTSRHPGPGTIFALTRDWRRVVIDLRGRDLRYVLGGFGWFASWEQNPDGAVFFLDDIQYELDESARARRLEQPRFLVSFSTLPRQPVAGNEDSKFDLAFRNVAFTYDNAVALLVFLAEGSADSVRRARLIGDAFVYATRNDRTYTDGRVRSAYAAGDIALPPGWWPNGRAGTVPVSGYYDEVKRCFKEMEQGTIDVGNNAWAMIALLALYRWTRDTQHLETARRIGTVIRGFKNTEGQYRGFLGGVRRPEAPDPKLRPWASTEHNIDVYAAFRVMAELTGESMWASDAEHARDFVERMWDPEIAAMRTGTHNPNKLNKDKGKLPLDAQTWAVLGIPEKIVGRNGALLDAMKRHHGLTKDGFDGFDFNEDRDGIWFEGTAQAALAHQIGGRVDRARQLLDGLRHAQSSWPWGNGGGIAAASHDGVSTGFEVDTGFDAPFDAPPVPFKLFRRLHVGATAWTILAQLGANPYNLRRTHGNP